MDEIDITPDKSGKVLKTILSPGDSSSGTPTPETAKFDSSVIKGWDIGILGMTIGEKARFLIQSDYAYGDKGSPPKIPGRTLSFRGADVSEAKDEGILKRIRMEGKGNHPKENAFITYPWWEAAREGSLDTRENVKYALGYGFENKIPS
ncbi:Peptidylprolyl isomerase, partial [Caligus rogercresseyi]